MDKIEEIINRGVVSIVPGKEKLEKFLRSDQKINVYLGIDPTSVHIHIGHAFPLRKLQQLSELGHKVTFLIGDFTALIGDTSDKDSERPVLTSEQIEENFQTYKKQAEKLLDFSKVTLRYNSEWLNKLEFRDIVQLTRHFTLNDFIGRELIKSRLKDGKSVSLPEVLYPVMQGYDSYFMDTDLQLGGTDQIFNMQAGRSLQKDLRNKESYIITNAFLTGTDGRKMSKSWGNAIWIDDDPETMYRKVMSIKDDLIVEYFELATNTPMDEVEKKSGQLKSGGDPLVLKEELAEAIVSELHSDQKAALAKRSYESTQRGDNLLDLPSISVASGATITSALVKSGTVSSNSAAIRLIEQGGVSDSQNNKIQDPYFPINEEIIVKIGKQGYKKFTPS